MLGFAGVPGAPVATAPPAPAPAAAAPAPFKSTMLGGVSPLALPPGGVPSSTPAGASTAPVSAASAPVSSGKGSLKSTMLGGVGPGAVLPGTGGKPAVPTASAGPPTPGGKGSLKSTMLGGVGAASVPPADPSAASQASRPPARLLGSDTVLGVAVPGIAPTRPGEAPPTAPGAGFPRTAIMENAPRPVAPLDPPPPIVPAPSPLEDMPAPSRPRLIKKRGVPIVAVAVAAGAALLVGGGVIAWFWRGAPPIAAQPTVTPDGRDVLHLKCDPASCASGTTAELSGMTATFQNGEADLPLAEALHVGDNPLVVHVDRPGSGRDEAVKMVVPVAYRVRADVSTMGSQHPSVTIHVDALPGSEVRVGGKPVTLDANGKGTYTLDETSATEGPADESRVVAIDVPYTVSAPPSTVPARPVEAGTVSARVAIAPLRVDAPCATSVVLADHVIVSGRAAKGASVTIDDAPAAVAADGSFEGTAALPERGERTVQVRSGTSAMVARTVHLSVKRAASLVEEAKAFEQQKTLGYDAAVGALTAAATGTSAANGEAMVVDGEVIEPRASGHRMLILVDDKRGCARGPCLARVVVGQDSTVLRGQRLRAYGHLARAFTTAVGQTVPEVEAEFILTSKR
jgi:hypothetical protein